MSNSRPKLPSFDPFNATPLESIETAAAREQIFVSWLNATTPPNTMPTQQLGKPPLLTPEHKQTAAQQVAAPNAPKKPFNYATPVNSNRVPKASRQLFFNPDPNDPAFREASSSGNCNIISSISYPYPSDRPPFK